MRTAINTWRQSYQDEKLEGLEKDPVFRMLMTALAYQANDTTGEIERMNSEVLQEFARLLTPFEVGRAVPASVAITVAPDKGVAERLIDDDDVFTIRESEYKFIPLLRTRLLNATISSLKRIDGRRWSVVLSFEKPVRDLSGFSFAVRNSNFKDLKLSIGKTPIPLVCPWDYSELPFNDCFDVDTIIYNKSQTYEPSSVCMDLFAKQNLMMYFVKTARLRDDNEDGVNSVEFTFEFEGTGADFEFNKDLLILNTTVLVNCEINTATLTDSTPIVRIAGYDSTSGKAKQFMHALRPSNLQIYGGSQIEIRRVSADRFNKSSLIKMLHSVVSRYSSDYGAFRGIHGLTGDKMMFSLYNIMNAMIGKLSQSEEANTPGVYMSLMKSKNKIEGEVSLDVKYLVTDGVSVNSQLSADTYFVPPAGCDHRLTSVISTPAEGSNEVSGAEATMTMSRYYLATNDRIVTKADIKAFCLNELVAHFGLSTDMIRNISVRHRVLYSAGVNQYEILAEIHLADNSAVRKFEANKAHAETMLQKMIEVRSTNIYPHSRGTLKIER